MRAYASLSPMFWTRGSGKRLRGHKEAQLVALYLMSSPATSMVGIFHLALPTLCHETGLTLEEASKGLRTCAEEGLVFWDEDEELVFVPALAKHQIGEKLAPRDHKVKGVARALAPFREHRFFGMFMDRYADCYSLPTDIDEGASESLARDDVPVLSCPDLDPDPASGSDARDPVSGVVVAVAPAKRSAKTKRRASAPETPIPNPFVPTDSHRRFCAEHGLDLALEVHGLVAWAEGKTAVSWNGTFTTRLINSVKWARERGGPRGGPRAMPPRQPDSGYSPTSAARDES